MAACAILPTLRLALWLVLAVAVVRAPVASADTQPPRFELVGSASLSAADATLTKGNVHIHAALLLRDAKPEISPDAAVGDRFLLVAQIATRPSACYNDTIFRNDFDGDGF